MNFTTLVSAAVVSLSLTASSFAQFGGGWNSGSINIGVGGGNSSVSFPKGGGVRTNNLQWGVNIGMGGGSGYGYPAPVYGGGCVPCPPPAVVVPYYGGCGGGMILPYSPFTQTYGNGIVEVGAPYYVVPCRPQFIVR